MSDPGNHDVPHAGEHRPAGPHETAQHDIAALALGEPTDPAIDQHVRTCALCQRDLDSYRQVADLARASKRATDVPTGPPPRVWDRITSELGLSDPTTGPPHSAEARTASDSPPPDDPPPTAVIRPLLWRRALVAAAAVVALAGTGITGWAIGHHTSGTTADRASQALLAAQPGTSGAAHGKAVVHRSAAGYSLIVTADGLPAPKGYYEVWLFNPSINEMVAVGTLGAGARGSFTVPDGIDLTAYHVVDVSAQKYDGNNTHERSVLRGQLTR